MNHSGGKSFIIECPCCGERLEIDRESGKVIKRWPKPEIAEGSDIFAEGMKKLEEEKARLDSYFDGAGEMLKNKEKELDSLFEKEKKRIEESGDFSRPDSPFDLD
ncbi:MAG: hypothetical protein J5706_07220 [Elusimicrobiales bacterium]|nr:hypothetical protein [Elusimicrobiales bacterium]